MKKVLNAYLGDATLFLVAIMGVLFFTQCKKDKDKPAGGVNSSFLVGKKWQIKAITVTPGIDVGQPELVTDLFSIMPACVKDNFTTYHADGTAVEDEAANKCAGTAQTRTYNWKLKDDGTLEGTAIDDFDGTYKAVKNGDTKVTITATGKLSGDDVVRTLTIESEAI
jgi:hypothetical protein